MSSAWFRRGAAAAATILAAAVVFSQSGQAPRKLTLVYNVNNAGYVDVCGCKHKEVRQGSITRRASFLKQLRATGRDLLILDGGSSLFALDERVKESELVEAVRKAELIVEAYNRMGYRAMAVGSGDLAAGLEVLKKLEGKAKFPFLSANLVDKSTHAPIFPTHAVVEVGGIRVGFFGLTLNTMSRAYLAKVAPGITITDPLEAAKGILEELRGKADLIIALSHLREETNFELISKLGDLEIVVDPFIQYGSHHTWIKDEEWQTFREDTLLLRSDGQGARLGVLDIQMVAPRGKFAAEDRLRQLREAVAAGTATEEEKAEIERIRGRNLFTFQRVSLEPHHLTDPEIDLLVEEWKKNIDPSQVAHLEDQLPKKSEFSTVEGCRKCHEKVYEFWKGTKHAHAMASLEATNDQHRFDCVGCHSLGYGLAFLDTSKIGPYANVQCESCHGTNTKHAEDPAKNPFRRITRTDCIVCHNKEQTRSEFNFSQARGNIQCPKE
jgi:2',3'-cyclic-nucleotide 2'-phosphodiesterase (5'-nucleotidase family)